MTNLRTACNLPPRLSEEEICRVSPTADTLALVKGTLDVLVLKALVGIHARLRDHDLGSRIVPAARSTSTTARSTTRCIAWRSAAHCRRVGGHREQPARAVLRRDVRRTRTPPGRDRAVAPLLTDGERHSHRRHADGCVTRDLTQRRSRCFRPRPPILPARRPPSGSHRAGHRRGDRVPHRVARGPAHGARHVTGRGPIRSAAALWERRAGTSYPNDLGSQPGEHAWRSANS